MAPESSTNQRLLQARALSGQLGMFAEENEIPRDLWDALEAEIYNYYKVDKNS
tara:strand:+ start:618 stop:776 length:159 start_codon:yes stop_codon:yes gene_type:complete